VFIFLDFGLLLSNQHKFPLPECSLNNLLRGEFNRDVDIVAEQLTGHSDKWLITTSSDGKVS